MAMPPLARRGRKARAMAGRSASSKDTTGDKPVLIQKGPAKRKSPMSEGADTVVMDVGTPKNQGPSKNAHPQGTSPIAQEKAQQEDNLEVTSLSLNIDDDGDKSGTDEDQGSIGKLISSTRKKLFGPALKDITNKALCARSWRPITYKDTLPRQREGVRGLPSQLRPSVMNAPQHQQRALKLPLVLRTVWFACGLSYSPAMFTRRLSLGSWPTALPCFKNATRQRALSTEKCC